MIRPVTHRAVRRRIVRRRRAVRTRVRYVWRRVHGRLRRVAVRVRVGSSAPVRAAGGQPYIAMSRLARAYGLRVTAGKEGGHNKGSLHALGRAIDVGTRGVSLARLNAFVAACRRAGYRVIDERVRPRGQRVWTGPHLHVQK